MRSIQYLFIGAAVAMGVAAAQPKVNAVVNNYSYIQASMPNYGIAQGSIFHIFGTGLGPVQTPVLPDLSKGDLQRSMNGVSVNVTVNGTTKQAPLYYVSATDIAGVLPSDVPTGNGTLTVTFNSQTSNAQPIKVVPAAFGMLTFTGNGTGTTVALDANNNSAYVTPTAAARPGEVLVLWGSGLGPASTTDDVHYPVSQTNLTNSSNVKVFIGGQPATIAYAGRSQFPGLDQINVTVPAGVSGCAVSVVVQTGDYVSNTATLAIAPSGRTCSEPTGGLTDTDLQTLLSKDKIRVGLLSLTKTTTNTPAITFGGVTIPGKTTTDDGAFGAFTEYSNLQVTAGALSVQQSSIGSCTVYQIQGNPATAGQLPTITPLDAGTITLKLPNGNTMTLQKEQGFYSLSGSDATGSPSPLFIPAAGGQFSFTNTGGADVGVFTNAQITMPPALVWKNMDAITSVIRSQGVTVTWDNTNPYNGFVRIDGSSFALLDQTGTNAAITGFSCTAPYSAGTFTVPSYVLLALTPGSGSIGGIDIPTGSLSLSLAATPVKFNASSVDYAILNASSETGKAVNYQ